MLKINRDLNFDPSICSILYTYTSIDEYFDLRYELEYSELDDTIFIIKDD